jgi:hypothetical protein
LRAPPRESNRRLAGDCRRAQGDRKRLQTPRRLAPLFGAVPRFDRIDTLKCRKAMRQSFFGCCGSRLSKHMRGGLRPNGRIGKPRRGKRSREHRLVRVPNRSRSSTDAQSEQRSEVVGSSLSAAAPTDLSQTRSRRFGRSVFPPRRRSWPLVQRSSHLGETSVVLMPRFTVGFTRANSAGLVRRVGGRGRATTDRSEGGARACSSKTRAGQNGMGALGIERCYGWLGGKSSEGQNPMGGCGAKQSHEARAGSNR